MTQEYQGLILDTLQEEEFTTNKFGQNFHVDSPTVIIGSANPQGGSWKFTVENEKVDLDEIPMIKPLIDRFDLIFAFKDNRNEDILEDYAYKKSEMEDRPAPDYTPYIAKHILYAKMKFPKPTFSEEARDMLNQYFVGIRKNYGSPRILETIYRIAQNITRLKLKNKVDPEDAKETVQFYNVILHQLDNVVASPSNPKDVLYEECLGILMESKYPISFEELVKSACGRNKQVERYVGRRFRLDENKKLRQVVDMLRNHSKVKEVQMRPVVLQYIHSDHSDHSDLRTDTPAENLVPKNIAEVSNPRSERSERAELVYEDTPKYTPNNGNGWMFKCYYCAKIGNKFETNIKRDYEHHGATKHHNKPMYPNTTTMLENGLSPQGKEWEV